MRLLVTRPQPDAVRTAERLRAMGHEVMVQSAQETVLLDPALPGDKPAAIVVTSRNGVRALARWPAAAAWRTVPAFAVGDATAEAARQEGFGSVLSADGDGAALAALVMRRLAPETGMLLYPAGAERSPVLEATLAGGGYRVATAVAYRMEPVEALAPEVAEALAEGQIDGILLYSPRSADAFLALLARAGLKASLAKVTIYAISEATAAKVAEVAPDIRTADHPDEAAVLRLIEP